MFIEFSYHLKREIAIQEQVKEMVYIAGRRFRKKYSQIGFDYQNYGFSYRDFLSLRRMGFKDQYNVPF